MSELDDDYDICGECITCGQVVQEAGAPHCDSCCPDALEGSLQDTLGLTEAGYRYDY